MVDKVGETPKNLGHLAEYVCLGLFKEPTHGYILLSKIPEMSLGIVKPHTGNFYTALQTYHKEGLITPELAPILNPRRRIYSLTDLGAASLIETIQRYQQSLTAFNALNIGEREAEIMRNIGGMELEMTGNTEVIKRNSRQIRCRITELGIRVFLAETKRIRRFIEIYNGISKEKTQNS